MERFRYMSAQAIPHAGGVEINIADRCFRPSDSQISGQSTTLAQGTASPLLTVQDIRIAGRFRCEVSLMIGVAAVVSAGINSVVLILVTEIIYRVS